MAEEILSRLTETQRMVVYTILFGFLSLSLAAVVGMIYPSMVLLSIILSIFAGGLGVAALAALAKLAGGLLDIQ
ncbi:MAG: hypothetical protein ACTSSP_12075 [Candidatus Asgardarchaeia archaeon]